GGPCRSGASRDGASSGSDPSRDLGAPNSLATSTAAAYRGLRRSHRGRRCRRSCPSHSGGRLVLRERKTMIHGIGTDLVQLRRMRAALERHGERFALRILAASEVEAWRAHRDPARFLAKRFAAKEAFGKALGTGVAVPATLH